MSSTCSVMVLNAVNHLSSLSSSRKTSLSSCTFSHSDINVACFRRNNTPSVVSSLEASGVGVGAGGDSGSSNSFTASCLDSARDKFQALVEGQESLVNGQ
jgi:hypothetical protein